MRTIHISNTLTGKKEVLTPLEPGKIRMYACGVTPYDHCHVGHAMQAIFFDTIRSYLEDSGYQVVYVRNFTDVDDKIINKAAALGIEPLALAEDIIASSQRDMAAIGIRSATHEPRVSESIPEIIETVSRLIDKGYAYATPEGDVYYQVRKKANYGCLSHRKLDDLRTGTREIRQGDKVDELDFALWKGDRTPGASWPSPWGLGRPGWHIECSAMARKFLGDYFDIHGGGRDLVFPHHENEIAQSEAANDSPYAKVWVHSGLMTISGQKMSKSLGNHIRIADFLEKWPAEVLRLAFLSHHYGSNIDFSEGLFKRCAQRLLYYYESLHNLDRAAPTAEKTPEIDDLAQTFHTEMCDDFNTASAIGVLNRGFRRANELAAGKPKGKAQARAYAPHLRQLFGILGLIKEEPVAFIASLKAKALPSLGISAEEIELLIANRHAAREAKDFARADSIRRELVGRGIELKDSPQGTNWTLALGDSEA